MASTDLRLPASTALAAATPATQPANVTALPSLINLEDYHRHAREHLPKQVYDYYRSGAHDELTLRDNVIAYQRLKLRPRFLIDVSNVSTKTMILGREYGSPVCVAPTAMQRMAHADGEIANAVACAATGTLMVLSSLSTTSMEDVAKAASGPRWYQLYVYRDRAITESLVRRAESSGYQALVLTVDTPQLGVREADVRNRFQLPSHLTMANFATDTVQSKQSSKGSGSSLAAYAGKLFDRSLSWKDLEWLKSLTRLPIVVKGVMTREDAELSVKHGASGIIVSNHGARQLDSVAATIEALPEVVAACQGTGVEVYMDGGIRRGTDVFKALALGAKAVFIGRPALWGLAYNGSEGLRQVLTLLNSELELAMSLAGCPTVASITRDRLISEHQLRPKL